MCGCWVSDSRTLFCVRLLGQWLAHSVLCLIVGLEARALCFVFDCYVRGSHFVLCLIVGLVTRALSFVFNCYVSDSPTLFCV